MKPIAAWLVCVTALFLAVIFPPKAHAVSVSIASFPSVITQDSFTLTASVSGAGNGTNYLRIDIYKEGSQNYFGETFNGTDWYSGSDYHQYLAIPIVSSSWSGTIQGNLGSPTTAQYDGTGTYRIRLRRYTGGGTSTASEADASSVVVSIVTPTPAPTPTPTPTPTPLPTPTPTKSPTPTPIPTPSPQLTPLLSSSVATITSKRSVLAAAITPIVSVEPQQTTSAFNWFPFLSIGSGILILGCCGILFFKSYRKTREEYGSTDNT